jgi:hypothetical protein
LGPQAPADKTHPRRVLPWAIQVVVVVFIGTQI